MRARYILPLVILTFVTAQAVAQTAGKRPVIIIPGITFSKIVDPAGKTVWFNVKRSKTDDLRLPMTSRVLSRNRDTLRPKDIIREVKLPVLPDLEFYKGLLDALEGHGYTEAQWTNAKASDVFYVFPYDWRHDNVETAHLLVKQMLAVKRALKRPDLKFDIMAHSMGGLVARYAAMYGLTDLPPEGRAPVPNWSGAAHIDKLMMFGTPNEGSFGVFDALLNGYPLIFRRNLPFVDDLTAQDLLSMPAAYQLMPHGGSARFLDENLQPIKVDLYDPETWIKYGWGAIVDPKFLGKLKDADRLAVKNKKIKPEKPDKDAGVDDRLTSQTTYAQVRSFFASALGRAKLFHRALNVTVTRSPIELYAYGGNCDPTLDAAVLVFDRAENRWDTLLDARDIKTSAGTEIKKDAVKAALFVMGDNRVTEGSLLAAAKTTTAGKAEFTGGKFPLKLSLFTCAPHNKLFLDKVTQDSFLKALAGERR